MSTPWRIDLNCDLGEGGPHDAELLRYVTSANIACGIHAGSPAIMRKTVELAVKLDVGLGAHPGLADAQGMGRREMTISPNEAFDLVFRQVEALQAVAGEAGRRVDHVKPHGTLYNSSARDPALADAIARAVLSADPRLILFGLAGSQSVRVARQAGLAVAEEAFVDRACLADGSLAPRGTAGAILDDVEWASRRAVTIIKEQRLVAIDGRELRTHAETLCVHGDSPGALAMLQRLHEVFAKERIAVKRVNSP